MKLTTINTRIFLLTLTVIFTSFGSSDDSVKVPQDTIAPTITFAQALTVKVESHEDGAVVSYVTPVGSDNVSLITSQIEGLPSGANYPNWDHDIYF